MASSVVVMIEVESSISATLVLEESSQTAMASRGVVSGKKSSKLLSSLEKNGEICFRVVKLEPGNISQARYVSYNPLQIFWERVALPKT